MSMPRVPSSPEASSAGGQHHDELCGVRQEARGARGRPAPPPGLWGHLGGGGGLTIEVHTAVPVEVHVLQDLVHLLCLQLLAQQRRDCLAHLRAADLPVPVHVELRRPQVGSPPRSPPQPPTHPGPGPAPALPVVIVPCVPGPSMPMVSPCPRCPRGRTSRKAIFSSLTPTMCAVSSRSFGPIICTKSSKSTRPPTAPGTGTASAPQPRLRAHLRVPLPQPRPRAHSSS